LTAVLHQHPAGGNHFFSLFLFVSTVQLAAYSAQHAHFGALNLHPFTLALGARQLLSALFLLFFPALSAVIPPDNLLRGISLAPNL
jgi:hypothetical protein